MTDLFERNGFSIILGPSGTALGYQGDLGCPIVLTGKDQEQLAGTNLKRIDSAAVMRRTVAKAQESGLDLDKKLVDGLVGTTALKTLVVLLGGTFFMVVHAKEPKTEDVGALLAKYCQNVIKDCQDLARKSGKYDEVQKLHLSATSWVIVVDTNIAKEAIDKAFRENVRGQVVPSGEHTTAKHRSILHGQCYDTKKCNKTVVAPKDHIIAPEGSLECQLIQPDLSKGMTLPTPHWGSDHSLLTAVYIVPDSQPRIMGA
jgi:hypothetical protein